MTRWPYLRTMALGLALVFHLPRSSAAAWPTDPLVNVPLCTAAGYQTSPAIVADGAGGAIVVWTDTRSGTTNPDIYAQHVLASGSVDPDWPVDGRAVCTATGSQGAPALVADGVGGAIVTWGDSRSGTSSDIYAQHVLASGAVDPAWPANGRALCTAVGDQGVSMIVADSAGGAIVVWSDNRAGTNNSDIYAQHVLASGAVDPVWPTNGRALCVAPNNQWSPRIALDGAGGAIITWYDYRSGSADIYAQHVLASGVPDPAWPVDGRALCTAPGVQRSPAIAADGAGGAIVTWYGGSPATPDLYAQRVLANGALDTAWPTDGRAVSAAATNHRNPTIVADGMGGAFIAWYDSSQTHGTFAQHVLASGAIDPAWPVDGRPLSTPASYQQFPAIVADGTGGVIITWRDYRSVNYGIYAQHVLESGAVDSAWPATGRALCIVANGQEYPAIVTDDAGGAIVVWQDYRGIQGTDIYAQRIQANGQLGGTAVTHDITATADPEGTIAPAGVVPVEDRRNQTFTITPAIGYHVADVLVDSISVGAVTTYTFTNVQSPHSISAAFAINSYTLALTSIGSGAVTQSPDQPNYVHGSNVTLTATADSGWHFVAWSGAATGSANPLAVTLDTNKTITAIFAINAYTLTAAAAGNGTVTRSPNQANYNHGTVVTLTAAPAANWHFVAWNGDVSGTENPLAIPMDANKAVTATFAINTYALDVVIDGGGAVVRLPDQPTYNHGSTVTLTATPDAGWHFVGWSGDASGAASTVAVTMDGSRTAVATFTDALEPRISSVADVPGDVGKQVRVTWARAYHDAAADPSPVTHYTLWRRIDLPPQAGAATETESHDTPTRTLAFPPGTWDFVVDIPARGDASYSTVAATFVDSTLAGMRWSVFLVSGVTANPFVYFDSVPDSGYSKDNIPPAVPHASLPSYDNGFTTLAWERNVETDFLEYRLYRGTDVAFEPGPASLLATLPDPGYADSGPAGSCYKLLAVDLTGNESGFAVMTLGHLLGTTDARPLALALDAVSPNPANGTRLHAVFVLAGPGAARLELLDVAGRRMAEREVGSLGAGRHEVELAITTRLAAGLYLVRLTQGERALSRRVCIAN